VFGYGTKKICANCGVTAIPKRFTKGSILIEIILWIIFLIPGLIYSFWRISTREDVCPSCKSSNIVGLRSPRGVKLVQEYSGVRGTGIGLNVKTAKMERCPFCLGKIPKEAAKCQHCGEWLKDPNEVPPPQPPSTSQTCPKCMHENGLERSTCSRCGEQLEGSATV